jgi:VanZ family protein
MKPSLKESSTRKLLFAWLAVAVWASIIFYFSDQPSLSTGWGVWDFILRKMAHFSEYAVLSILLLRALKAHGINQLRALQSAALVALVYAFSDELHQRFVPGRTSALRDVGFDFAGIACALMIAYRKQGRQRPAN